MSLELKKISELWESNRWFLITICCFTASLGKYEKNWLKEVPQLVYPIEQLRDLGRPITLSLYIIVISIVLLNRFRRRKNVIPKPLFFLVAIQAILSLKIFMYGDTSFALMSIFAYSLLILMMIYAPSYWVKDNRNFSFCLRSIAFVGVIFAVVNVYQACFDIYPISFTNGWFLGTTANPQFTALLIVSIIPAILFLIHNTDSLIARTEWLSFLFISIFGLILTSSRTGLTTAIVSIVVFYGFRFKQVILNFIVVLLAAFASILFISQSKADLSVIPSVLDKGFNNTRTAIWFGQLSSFLEHPIFGVPLEGDRISFQENSWLAVAVSLGIMGLIPLGLFLVEYIRMIFQVQQFANNNPNYYWHCRAVLAGLVSLLIGTITEAYLLALFNFTTMAMMLYMILGNYLIQINSLVKRTMIVRQQEASVFSSSKS